MNKSLTRSIGFWLLLVLSLASTGVGGWTISGQIGTMTTTLADGTATGVEVYVGQSLVVVGAALLGAGVLGILLAVALTAVRALIPTAAPAIVEPIDWAAENDATIDEPATSITADQASSTDLPSSETPAEDAAENTTPSTEQESAAAAR
ncbi:hypothetical protein SRABI76_00549 [Microbacterium oxydans]|uniref:hypothetical protein n=1 Tax=Microbacterium oxydans TaxID=82380 RepID=UPI001D938D44|nr:hypothetical protein [Microbacterium oxydans]CAH0141305.1 hypothetical protein SRABI76_00549 [Microbacterium oxydans]